MLQCSRVRFPALWMPVAALVAWSCGGTGPAWEEACAGVDCGSGRCVVDAEGAACVCDPGTAPRGLTCAAVDACSPNPCTAQFQTTCVVDGDAAQCLCDLGHPPDGAGGCSPQAIWNCDEQLTGGVPDPFEPDACPAQASILLADGVEVAGHTLDPAADSDWFRIDPVALTIYEVQVSSASSTPLVLEAFAEDGVSALAADYRGTPSAIVRFKAPGDAPVFVRVRALRTSDAGEYVITAFERGPDDFADTAATATPFEPGQAVEGHIQFYGDADVMRLSLIAGHSYWVKVSWAGSSDARVELMRGDGTTAHQALVGQALAMFTLAREAENAFVRITAESPAVLGSYTLQIIDLGRDDHGDVAAEATPMAGAPVGVTMDRPSDVDVLRFELTPGLIYAVNCAPVTGSDYLWGTLLDENGIVLDQQGFSSSVQFAMRTSQPAVRYLRLARQVEGANPLSHSCSLAEVGTDDHGDTPAEATPLPVGSGTRWGTIEVKGDRDVFSFPAQAGRIYWFACSMGGAYYGCNLRLLSAAGTVLASSSELKHEALTSDTYYVEVTKAANVNSGSYTYLLEDIGTDDHGDTPAAASPITASAASQKGRLETAGDRDVFSFTGTALHVYRFHCTSGASAVCDVRFLDSNGAELASGGGFVAVQVAAEVQSTGTYFVEVASASGPATYTWVLEDAGVDDHGDDLNSATTAAVPMSGPHTAVLESGADLDVFRLAATAGRIYRFTCVPGSAPACAVRALDSAGTLVSSVQGAVVSFVATSSESYYFEVGSGGSTSNAGGTYTWLLEDLGTDDHANAPAGATPLTVGASQPGELQYGGDVDLFSFAATPDRIYRVSCAALASASCGVSVTTATGALIAQGTGTVTLRAPLNVSGLYVKVLAAASASGVAYSILVEDLGVDDHADTAGDATPLATGTPVSGTLNYSGDQDYFSATLSSGTTTTVTLTGTTLLRVAVFDSAGAQLADGTSPRTFTVATSGIHFFKVYALTSSSAPPIPYTISVQ